MEVRDVIEGGVSSSEMVWFEQQMRDSTSAGKNSRTAFASNREFGDIYGKCK
jgi:hypothetical protein